LKFLEPVSSPASPHSFHVTLVYPCFAGVGFCHFVFPFCASRHALFPVLLLRSASLQFALSPNKVLLPTEASPHLLRPPHLLFLLAVRVNDDACQPGIGHSSVSLLVPRSAFECTIRATVCQCVRPRHSFLDRPHLLFAALQTPLSFLFEIPSLLNRFLFSGRFFLPLPNLTSPRLSPLCTRLLGSV